MDTNAVGSSKGGASKEKIEALPRFRDSDLYTAEEKAALALAEAMSATPVEVSDELFAELRRFFDERQLVELAATISMENERARFNRAFGVESQGFYQRM
jgi:alkylhydroperoxidase family enzyme